MNTEKQLTGKESLEIITMMINKAKESYHETGASVIMWGAVIALCSLVRFSEIQFGYKLPFDIYLLTLVAIIPQVYFAIKEKREKKVASYDDVFMNYLWLGFGISIFLLILIVNTVGFNLLPVIKEYDELTKGKANGSFDFIEYIAPLFLLLYGLPTFVTGAVFKFRPMMWGG